MARHKNGDWNIPDQIQWTHVPIALLMDLRDELREMNRKLNVLDCGNFLRIPHKLDCIRRNTDGKKAQRKKRAKS